MKNDCRIFLITYIMRTVRAGISEDSRGWGEGVGGREREREEKRLRATDIILCIKNGVDEGNFPPLQCPHIFPFFQYAYAMVSW